MASVIFGSTLNMLTAATPSSGGYVVAYDLDGILKQKDEFGIITEIGGGPTSGAGLTPSLSDVMGIDNNSNIYSLIMGTSTSLLSANGGGQIDLDYSGTNSILISTDNASGGEHGVLMENGYYALYANGYSQALLLDDGSENIVLYNTVGDLQIGVNTGVSPIDSVDELKISNNGSLTASTGDNDKQAVFVGTRNSIMSPGVVNSVIIGGEFILGSQSNYVYIGGSLNINNSYTFPNIDGSPGELLSTDGLGNINWSSSTTSGLSEVLSVDNNSGINYIIMGTSTGILSSNGDSQIYLDYGASNSIFISSNGITNISLDNDITIDTNDVLNIGANTASVVTDNLQGFVYGFDYSGTFVTNSLVSKYYVDNGTASIWNEINNINNDYITEVIGGIGLTGGGTAGVVTLDVNLETNSGLTFSGDDITLELNSNSLEVDSNNQIRLKDTVVGNRTFADSVIISGDLTVSGTATYVNTEELYVADNIITLNATYSTGTPFLDAGIHVLRGSSQSSSLLWNETLEYWQVGLSGSESTIITEAGEGLLKSNNELSVDFGTVSSISYVDSQVSNYLPLAGGTMSGDIAMSSGTFIKADGGDTNLSLEPTYWQIDNKTGTSSYTESWIYGDDRSVGIGVGNGTISDIYASDNGISLISYTYGTKILMQLGTIVIEDNTNLKGAIYGADYSANFTLRSLVDKGYVDGGTASLWVAIDNINNDYITEVIGGQGLTGGGTAGVVTLDANTSNGLSISNDNIVLGGTLSQNTVIDGQGYDITLSADYMFLTSSVFDIESDFISLDSGTGSTQIMSGSDTSLVAGGDLDLLATNGVYVVGSSFSVNAVEIDPTSASTGQALVYDGVKFSPSTLSGDIAGITAGAGLTGGGSSGYVTLDAQVNNGLSITSDNIGLGGTLSSNTTIDINSNFLDFRNGDIYYSIDNSNGASFIQSGDPAVLAIGKPYGLHYTHLLDDEFGSNLLVGEGSDTKNPEIRFRRFITTGLAGPGGLSIPNGESLGDITWTGNNILTGATESAVIRSTVSGVGIGAGIGAELKFLTNDGGSGLEEHMVITNNGKVAIGTASTSSKLHVFGDFRLEDGTQMDGYFLKSDANGVASWSPVEGDIAGITAGAGLTGGGSSGYVTLDAQVNNGLSITSDYIGLGGTLSSSTIIDISTNNIQFNSNTQSGLLTLDGTNKRVGVLTDDPFNDQVAYAGDSDYASNFVLRTETQNYGLNHNDGTAEFNTYIDPSFFGVGVMFGSTTNHGVGIYTNDYNRIWIDGGDNITGGNVQIGNNAPTFTYKLEVSGTVSTTGFRMTDGASDGYFLKSDANGVASWSPVEGDIAGITAGAGLTGGGSSGYVTLDVDFGTVSSIAYVDNGTASLWAAIESNNELSEILSNGNETLGNDMIVSDTDYILFGSDNITTGHNISGASGGTFFIQSPENIEVNSDKNISIKSGTSSGNDGISLFGGGATDYSLGFAYIGGPTSDNTQIGYGSDAYMTFRDNGSPGNERVSIYVSGVQVMAFDDTGNTLRTASGDTTVDNDTTDGLLKYSVDPTTTTTWTDRSIPDKSYVDSQVIGLTTKTSDVRTFFIGVVETITHTLNTEDLIIQTYDSTGVQIIPDTIQITGTSSVDITLSQTLSSVKTIIIG